MTKKIKDGFYLIFCLNMGFMLLFHYNKSTAQINSISIKDQFFFKEAPNLSEKIQLHADRSDYIAGEIIWFKAYYLLNNQPNANALSKVIYLELVDVNGISVAQGKYMLDNSCSNGTLQIPSTILSGNYTLFAYTKWMRNLGIMYYFNKNIVIINPDKSVFISKPDSNVNKLKLNFYPEGGKLISGFKNNVFYTINPSDSNQATLSVRIVADNNITITEFNSGKDYIGKFDFIPQKNVNYQAIITKKDNSIQIFNLPKVFDYGISVKIKDQLGESVILEFSTDENTSDENKTVKIEIESNGFIYKTIHVTISDSEYSEIIPKKELISGWNKISVKNKVGEVLYENNFEVKLNNDCDIDLITDKDIYGKREKIKLLIKTINKSKINRDLQLSLSVSKTKDEKFSKYYDFYGFRSEKVVVQNSDLYKKPIYSTQAKSNIAYLPETSGIILAGYIKTKSSNQAICDADVYLSTLKNDVRVQNTLTNADGKFYFKLDGLIGKSDVALQIKNQSITDHKIEIENDYSSDFLPNPYKAISENAYDKEFYERLLTNYQIEQQYSNIMDQDSIMVTDKKCIFYGKSDTTYYLKKYIELPTLEDFFNEIVEEVQVKKKKYESEIFISYGKNKYNLLTLSPLLLLDGVPIFDIQKFLKISVAEIEKIDVINNNYILGEKKYGGIISLFSKNGNLANIANNFSLSFKSFDGFMPKMQFKQKDYSDLNKLESRIPDIRNTVYWNPKISINEKSETEVSFYTSDETGKYLVTLMGYDANGEAINFQKIIEVK